MSSSPPERKRLLFVSNLFPSRDEPVRGLDNATMLQALASRWEIRAFSPRPVFPPWKRPSREAREVDRPFQPRFVKIAHLPKIGDAVNLRFMIRGLRPVIEKCLDEFNPDVVLCSWLFPDGCAMADLAERNGVPLVLITQGTDTHHYLQRPYRRSRILKAIGCSQAVVCRSEDLAGRLKAAGASEARLATIYNGIDPTVFHPRNRQALREELQIEPARPLLLFVGNFLPVKDPRFLIRAHRELNQRRFERGDIPARLVMIGDGPLKAKMRQDAGADCDLLAPMAPEGIARWMGAADLLCLSSRNEGFPNVILEAFAAGLPVLSTDVGGIGELLDRPARGQLVEPGDLDAYVDALERALEPRENASSPSAIHSWDEAADLYHALLERATHTSGSAE